MSVDAASLMNWQTSMSNTAHQREVADLKAAGLNPVLSAKYGGASVPSGAMDSESAGHGGGGSGYSLNNDGSRDGWLGGLIDTLPDKGNTRLFGFSVPNTTLKYLYDSGVTALDQVKDAITAFAGDNSLGIKPKGNSAASVGGVPLVAGVNALDGSRSTPDVSFFDFGISPTAAKKINSARRQLRGGGTTR